jgi:subtilisin-like proprotein convertase family protein
MSYKTCAKCGANDLVWAQSKKGNWYLAVEKKWVGDMGAIRTYLPAHICND